jgi:hypothetical protein
VIRYVPWLYPRFTLSVRDVEELLALRGIEAEGPSTLLRAGIKAKSFMPGESVTVIGNPMKDGRFAGALISVTKKDGTVFSPRPPPTTAQ